MVKKSIKIKHISVNNRTTLKILYHLFLSEKPEEIVKILMNILSGPEGETFVRKAASPYFGSFTIHMWT